MRVLYHKDNYRDKNKLIYKEWGLENAKIAKSLKTQNILIFTDNANGIPIIKPLFN